MHHRNRWTWALAAVLCMVLLAGMAGCSKESKKESHFKKGETYLSESKFREAVIEFKNVLQIDPNDAKAQHKLGMAQLGAGDPREAYAAFSKAVELDPNFLEPRLQLGRLYLMARDSEKAREQARLILEKDPKNAQGHQLMSMVYLGDRKLPAAIAEAAKAVEADPKRAETHLHLAGLHILNKDLPRAEEAFKAAAASARRPGTAKPQRQPIVCPSHPATGTPMILATVRPSITLLSARFISTRAFTGSSFFCAFW